MKEQEETDKVMSQAEMDEIMSDPDLVAGIREGVADIAAGRTFSLEEIRAAMRAAGR